VLSTPAQPQYRRGPELKLTHDCIEPSTVRETEC